MIEIYENDNHMIDLSMLPSERPTPNKISEDDIRKKALALKTKIMENKKAAR